MLRGARLASANAFLPASRPPVRHANRILAMCAAAEGAAVTIVSSNVVAASICRERSSNEARPRYRKDCAWRGVEMG
eukprot:scaffold9146_cov31-Tisochrysis_lutea.AAC.1